MAPVLVALAVALVVVVSSAGPSGARGTVSGDGLSAGDGVRALRVGQSQGLQPGQSVPVSGSGYDITKGIYVALCVVTPSDRPPSPCGGGIDIDGVSGASAWISSDPPSYGAGLAQPYGPGGTFSVSVSVGPEMAGGFDCRRIQCAIVTRNDHVRTADRSQDLLIPVTFATEAAPPPTTAPGPTTTLAPPPAPTTTAPPAAPPTELSDDGRTGAQGSRRVVVSDVEGLDPTGTQLRVEGSGFDPALGVLVTLCRMATVRSAAPGPCYAGSTPDASRWITDTPPAELADRVTPWEEGGRFAVSIDVAAVIDGETDCRRLECAVVVRRDDTAADDRSLDVVVPVRFAAEAPPAPTPTDPSEVASATTTSAPVATAATSDADDGGGMGLALVGGGAAALVVAGAVVAARRRGATPDAAAEAAP